MININRKFRSAIDAFSAAVKKGIFDMNPDSKDFQGYYTYIHSDEGIDYFKNTVSGEFVAHDTIKSEVVRGAK